MKFNLLFFIIFFFFISKGQTTDSNVESMKSEFFHFAQQIEIKPINSLMMQQNGRLKPLDTLARETILYLSGSYQPLGIHPVSTYVGLVAYENSKFLEILELRDKKLRTELGFLKSKKYYSQNDLETSSLAQLAEPLFKKQQQNSRSLDEHEKKVLEAYSQLSLLKELTSGQSFLYHADFGFLNQDHNSKMEISKALQKKAKAYFSSLASGSLEQKNMAKELIEFSKTQEAPAMFQHYREKVDLEIFYNEFRFFLFTAILAIFLGVAFLTPLFQNKVSLMTKKILYLFPMLLLALGLGIRVYITEFAPVTNMFGTMIWVSFGAMFFSFILFIIYNNLFVPGVALIASGLILLLTEKLPLVLSPDMDPIVAVLRSNFWLSTHVTTITISYAAYTIAMILGNIALIRLWFIKDNTAFVKEYSHYAYRMIQLGCFLLTVGIILGGVWADYSWGRFWGWDPKETWALIADLGFLAILHGRFAGWITPLSLLLWSPLAYLLVIMAWYGVNFILAAGLHSYGFSSGGALMVGIFVSLQLFLLMAGFLKSQRKVQQ